MLGDVTATARAPASRTASSRPATSSTFRRARRAVPRARGRARSRRGNGADRPRLLGLVRRAARRRVQRLPPARGRHRDLDGLRQRHASRNLQQHIDPGDLTRGRHHPRAPGPLRRHLRAARAAAVRRSSGRASRCSRPAAPSERLGDARRELGRHVRRGTRSTTATRRAVGSVDLRVLAHGPPAADVRGRGDGADGRRLVYTVGHRPGLERRRVRRRRGPRAVGGVATSTTTSRSPIHLSARQAGAAAREAAGPAARAHPPLAPGRPGGRRSRKDRRRSASRSRSPSRTSITEI